MDKLPEVDFEVIKSHVEGLTEYIVNNRGKSPEELENNDMLEGFLLIATKATRLKGGGLSVPDAIASAGGCFDPVTHELAKILLSQPQMHERLNHWLKVERAEYDHGQQRPS